ncbi:MAG: hypothetical protein V1936_02075 [Patescibacteria group bacterium]
MTKVLKSESRPKADHKSPKPAENPAIAGLKRQLDEAPKVLQLLLQNLSQVEKWQEIDRLFSGLPDFAGRYSNRAYQEGLEATQNYSRKQLIKLLKAPDTKSKPGLMAAIRYRLETLI